MLTEFLKIKAEHEEFRKKLLVASPEEKENLIKERAEEIEKRKIEREKERYEERKNRFYEKCDKQIDCYKSLIKAQKTAIEIVKSFDGKVINARLTNAINQKLEKYVYASLKFDKWNSCYKITITDGNYHGCFNEFSFKVISKDWRVDWSKTENQIECNLDSFIETYKNAKKNYEKVYKKMEKLNEMIEDWSNEQFEIRNFIKEEGLIKSYYL